MGDDPTKKKADAKRVSKQPHEAIHLPKNSGAGITIAACSGILGFAVIWRLWPLAIAGLIGLIAVLIVRLSNDDTHHYIPAKTVAAIEKQREHQWQNP